MEENTSNSETTVITVADEEHPFSYFRHFFLNKNNILISIGIGLFIAYFFFAYGAVKSALLNASEMIHHNREMAKEYKDLRRSEMMMISRLDSLDKHKFDRVLLDSISLLKDTIEFHRGKNEDFSNSLTEIREKFVNAREDLTIMRADLQSRIVEVEQLKAQREYNERFYKKLTFENDSIEAENYKLRIQLKTLQKQLVLSTTVKK